VTPLILWYLSFSFIDLYINFGWYRNFYLNLYLSPLIYLEKTIHRQLPLLLIAMKPPSSSLHDGQLLDGQWMSTMWREHFQWTWSFLLFKLSWWKSFIGRIFICRWLQIWYVYDVWFCCELLVEVPNLHFQSQALPALVTTQFLN
jgi:hypothetical protein